jgi:hypothetical protein
MGVVKWSSDRKGLFGFGEREFGMLWWGILEEVPDVGVSSKTLTFSARARLGTIFEIRKQSAVHRHSQHRHVLNIAVEKNIKCNITATGVR